MPNLNLRYFLFGFILLVFQAKLLFAFGPWDIWPRGRNYYWQRNSVQDYGHYFDYYYPRPYILPPFSAPNYFNPYGRLKQESFYYRNHYGYFPHSRYKTPRPYIPHYLYGNRYRPLPLTFAKPKPSPEPSSEPSSEPSPEPSSEAKPETESIDMSEETSSSSSTTSLSTSLSTSSSATSSTSSICEPSESIQWGENISSNVIKADELKKNWGEENYNWFVTNFYSGRELASYPYDPETFLLKDELDFTRKNLHQIKNPEHMFNDSYINEDILELYFEKLNRDNHDKFQKAGFLYVNNSNLFVPEGLMALDINAGDTETEGGVNNFIDNLYEMEILKNPLDYNIIATSYTNGVHFVALYIDLEKKTITMDDSGDLFNDSRKDEITSGLKNYLEFALKKFPDHERSKAGLKFADLKWVIGKDVPKQEESPMVHCGLFACSRIENIFKTKISEMSSERAPWFRLHMLHESIREKMHQNLMP